LNGITIHEFLGLKDGRFSADELSEKIQNDTIYGTVKKNISYYFLRHISSASCLQIIATTT
jgi:hypothetical protein